MHRSTCGTRRGWPLDENAGDTAEDVVGPNDGVHVGGPASIGGKVAGALRFDGTGSSVEVPDHPSLRFGTGDLSVDAWIRTSSLSLAPEKLVDKRREQAAGGPQGFTLFVLSGTLRFQLASGGSAANFDSGWIVNDGDWHHLAVTVVRDDPAGGRSTWTASRGRRSTRRQSRGPSTTRPRCGSDAARTPRIPGSTPAIWTRSRSSAAPSPRRRSPTSTRQDPPEVQAGTDRQQREWSGGCLRLRRRSHPGRRGVRRPERRRR